jgi:1,4-dihydroxy-2-naphthoate octaprenyltransferase
MTGDTYYFTAGQLPYHDLWLNAIPYPRVMIAILIGKHIDKLEADKAKGILTLPVLLGQRTFLR